MGQGPGESHTLERPAHEPGLITVDGTRTDDRRGDEGDGGRPGPPTRLEREIARASVSVPRGLIASSVRVSGVSDRTVPDPGHDRSSPGVDGWAPVPPSQQLAVAPPETGLVHSARAFGAHSPATAATCRATRPTRGCPAVRCHPAGTTHARLASSISRRDHGTQRADHPPGCHPASARCHPRARLVPRARAIGPRPTAPRNGRMFHVKRPYLGSATGALPCGRSASRGEAPRRLDRSEPRPVISHDQPDGGGTAS